MITLAHLFALSVFSLSNSIYGQMFGLGELGQKKLSYSDNVCNSILRVWIDDNAIVTVNGKETQPQHWTGSFCGSRLFSISGLTPNRDKEVIVLARYQEPGQVECAIEERTVVQLGGYHEVRLQNPNQLAYNGVHEQVIANHLHAIPDDMSRNSAVLIAESVKRAQEAAAKAQMFADRAEKRFGETMAEINTANEHVSKQAEIAEQGAKQAARNNSETIELEQDHKPIVMWVSYSNNGSIAELALDHLTPQAYKLIGKGGAIQNLAGLDIVLNFYFTVEKAGSVERNFQLLEQTGTFNKGESLLTFISSEPVEAPPMWHQFATAIQNNWSRIYHGEQQIKVAIKAIRPDGSEFEVAGVGNRLTIEFRTNK